VNIEGFNDAGFAGAVSSRCWNQLANTGKKTLGDVLTKNGKDKTFHALVCHSLGGDGWSKTAETVTKCLDSLNVPETETIAIVLMGTGMLGQMGGADFFQFWAEWLAPKSEWPSTHCSEGGEQMSKILSSERVEAIFNDCLFKDGEDTSNYVKAEGIAHNVGFHPERLQSHKAEIEAMLDELPDQFKKSGGGGWSFLNACLDKHGEQWTDLHLRMEQLFQLGIAIGKVECQLPREMWMVFPGGMPYYVIN